VDSSAVADPLTPGGTINRSMPIVSRAPVMWCLLVGLLLPVGAAAQDVPAEKLPIARYVIDARADFPKFKQDAAIANAIGAGVLNLPTRGFGIVAGAHVYPFRVGLVTFGFGAEWMKAGRSRTLNTGTEAAPKKVTVNSRLSMLAPQISFNFGSRNGYSYISGGVGTSNFTVERSDTPLPDPDSGAKTINYGGGARWFTGKHIAVSMDLRFYAINPQLPTTTRPGYPRMTLMTMRGGISVR
jgi:hypothetical protein